MTITEALAEIKTIEKRILAKKNFISQYANKLKDESSKRKDQIL